MSRVFSVGENVFAKVRGYPAWPARVEKITDGPPSKCKYHVHFYGTGETGVCNIESLFKFEENKEKYGKPMKRKGFLKAMLEIQGLSPDTNDKTKRSIGQINSDNIADTSFGKKSSKRKRKSGAEWNTSGSPGSEKSLLIPSVKRFKKANSRLKNSNDLMHNAQCFNGESISGPSKNHEPVSFSGRRITPKKFADKEMFGVSTLNNRVAKSTTVKPIPNAPVSKNTICTVENDTRSISPSKYARLTVKTMETINNSIDRITAQSRAYTNRSVSGPSNVTLNAAASAAAHGGSNNSPNVSSSNSPNVSSNNSPNASSNSFSNDTSNSTSNITSNGGRKRRILYHHARDFPRQKSLLWYKTEARMLELEMQIKEVLPMNKIPNSAEGLRLLWELDELQVHTLMLKKHPQVMRTIVSLRRYVGNTSKWDMSSSQRTAFLTDAFRIRNKADRIYQKFRTFFCTPDGEPFWAYFLSQVEKFRKATESLSSKELCVLLSDPTAPPFLRSPISYDFIYLGEESASDTDAEGTESEMTIENFVPGIYNNNIVRSRPEDSNENQFIEKNNSTETANRD